MLQNWSEKNVTIEVPLRLVPKAFLRPGGSGALRLSVMASPLTQIVAQRLREAILAAGYTSQDQFANETGISRGTLSRVLSCGVDARLSTIESIAEKLGCSAHQLLQSTPFPGVPEGKDLPNLKKTGHPWKPEIFVKIEVPVGVEPPEWLKQACEHGKVVPTKRRRAEAAAAPQPKKRAGKPSKG